MYSIRHILFPIDLSAADSPAKAFVEAMVRELGADLTLVSVRGAGALVRKGDLEMAQRDFEARVDGVSRRRIEAISEIGDPAEAITRIVQTHGMDLIMMPTRADGSSAPKQLGSVTTQVLREAPGPVWTWERADASSKNVATIPRSVLCAMDATPKSTPALYWAAEFANRVGAKLLLVHAIPDDQPGRREKAVVEIQRLQRLARIVAELHVEHGSVPGVVLEYARKLPADLLVIGRGLPHDTLGRLCETAHALILQSPCPVVSV